MSTRTSDLPGSECSNSCGAVAYSDAAAAAVLEKLAPGSLISASETVLFTSIRRSSGSSVDISLKERDIAPKGHTGRGDGRLNQGAN